MRNDAIKEHVKEILLFCAYLNLNFVTGRCAHIAAVDPQRCKNATEILVAISEKEPYVAISRSIEIFEEWGQLAMLDDLMPRIAERNLASVVERYLRELPNLQRHKLFRGILEKLAETRNAEMNKLVEQIRKTPEGAPLLD